ncbi:SLC13 family permease [Nocardia sp. NPDC006630]|uniref:SLC13 family permease n=1 Tax=Nocardia sp. NPDC006630 TaxID=3157181 RepID=UPI0033BB0746
MWVILAGLGALAVVTGWLPSEVAYDIGVTRAAPILGFLVAVTVLAELADIAGVFDIAAVWCARLARGSTLLLFGLTAVLATVTTICMSLDTTAVLLTPVVLALTRRLGLAPLPFAFLVVWLANTASLLLPVSNLTNLLALQHANTSTRAFAAHMVIPQLVAVTLTVVYLGIVFRRHLTGSYAAPEPVAPADRLTCIACALACGGFAVAIMAGVPPWLAATAAAAATLAIFALRGRKHLSWTLLPWRLILTTEGLFLTVTALVHHGLGDLLVRWSGGSGARTTAVAAAASNLINNLPAYLAMETAVPQGNPNGIYPVLLGTNIGPLVTVWGSMATLLWAQRCRARGVPISARTFATIGIIGMPIVLLGTWFALPGR